MRSIYLVLILSCVIVIPSAQSASSRRLSDSSSKTLLTTTTKIKTKRNQHHRSSSSKKHTLLTGYGSHSNQKSIFVDERVPAIPNSKNQNHPSLSVYRSKDGTDLWFQSSRGTNEKSQQIGTAENQVQNYNNTAYQVCLSVVNGTLSASCSETIENEIINSLPDAAWVPIEGLYGVYQVPSGYIAVLITSSQKVYTAPPYRVGTKKKHTHYKNWWQIRRVQSLELVHLPSANQQQQSLSQRQIKEQARQIRLLRDALRHHNFYYVSSFNENSEGNDEQEMVVTDMTHTLQRSFERLTLNSTSSTSNKWWGDDDDDTTKKIQRPDSRFFWNEPALESLLEQYNKHKKASQDTEGINGNAYPILLQHVIPVTSAFVGIQTNVTMPPETVTSSDFTQQPLQYDEVLISRRSRFRAGTRFTKRGADETGAVTNFAETEQVCLICHSDSASKEGGKQNSKSGNGGDLQQVMSFVQTRGSIPLRWSSPADVKTYAPKIRIGTDPLAQARAFRSHLVEQCSLYCNKFQNGDFSVAPRFLSKKQPQLVFVNLIEKKKDQGRLGKAFDSVLEAVLEVHGNVEDDCEEEMKVRDQHNPPTTFVFPPNMVEHTWYDFHAETKGGQWGKLQNLLDTLSPTLEEHGYLWVTPPSFSSSSKSKWEINRRQNGVVRTNCMDCLDRTNVVQSIFGRFILFRQLYEQSGTASANTSSKNRKSRADSSIRRTMPLNFATVFRRNGLSLPWSTGEVSHRLIWADNADAISHLYAGTPALKGDFTRTGKRTKQGALDDGINSLQRYYINNFLDADRQEGMDLLVGSAGFTMMDDDDVDDQIDVHNDNDKNKMDGTIPFLSNPFLSSLDPSSMTIQEAARSVMLGDAGQSTSNNNGQLQKERKAARRPLDLRWLPGDLQGHMRSRAATIGVEISLLSTKTAFDYYSIANHLEAMDRRAAHDEPWWVIEDDLSRVSDNGSFSTTVKNDSRVLGSAVDNFGYGLGSLIAVSRAPYSTVGVVVCMFALGLFPQFPISGP